MWFLKLVESRCMTNCAVHTSLIGINEYDDPTLSVKESLMDTFRIDYHFRHLFYLRSAIE
jgi:beta-glucosidase